jgi:hypothetical protein
MWVLPGGECRGAAGSWEWGRAWEAGGRGQYSLGRPRPGGTSGRSSGAQPRPLAPLLKGALTDDERARVQQRLHRGRVGGRGLGVRRQPRGVAKARGVALHAVGVSGGGVVVEAHGQRVALRRGPSARCLDTLPLRVPPPPRPPPAPPPAPAGGPYSNKSLTASVRPSSGPCMLPAISNCRMKESVGSWRSCAAPGQGEARGAAVGVGAGGERRAARQRASAARQRARGAARGPRPRGRAAAAAPLRVWGCWRDAGAIGRRMGGRRAPSGPRSRLPCCPPAPSPVARAAIPQGRRVALNAPVAMIGARWGSLQRAETDCIRARMHGPRVWAGGVAVDAGGCRGCSGASTWPRRGGVWRPGGRGARACALPRRGARREHEPDRGRPAPTQGRAPCPHSARYQSAASKTLRLCVCSCGASLQVVPGGGRVRGGHRAPQSGRAVWQQCSRRAQQGAGAGSSVRPGPMLREPGSWGFGGPAGQAGGWGRRGAKRRPPRPPAVAPSTARAGVVERARARARLKQCLRPRAAGAIGPVAGGGARKACWFASAAAFLSYSRAPCWFPPGPVPQSCVRSRGGQAGAGGRQSACARAAGHRAPARHKI